MKKVTYDTLPEAISELLERVGKLEKLLVGNTNVSKPKETKIAKTSKSKKTGLTNGDMINIQQASELLNISVLNLYAYVRNKKIPFQKDGRRLVFSKTELENWSKSRDIKKQIKTDDAITVKDAEKLLNVSSAILYYYIKSRNIPVLGKKGNKKYFSKQLITEAVSKEGKKKKAAKPRGRKKKETNKNNKIAENAN